MHLLQSTAQPTRKSEQHEEGPGSHIPVTSLKRCDLAGANHVAGAVGAPAAVRHLFSLQAASSLQITTCGAYAWRHPAYQCQSESPHITSSSCRDCQSEWRAGQATDPARLPAQTRPPPSTWPPRQYVTSFLLHEHAACRCRHGRHAQAQPPFSTLCLKLPQSTERKKAMSREATR